MNYPHFNNAAGIVDIIGGKRQKIIVYYAGSSTNPAVTTWDDITHYFYDPRDLKGTCNLITLKISDFEKV